MRISVAFLIAVVTISLFSCCYRAQKVEEGELDSDYVEQADSVGSSNILSDDAPYEQWAEMPIMSEDSRYQYVVHYTELSNGEQIRNYSLCYDTQNAGAVWVAYPYHAVYDGDSGRSSSWSVDPLISEYLQPNLSSSYQSSLYDRGHQIPSADRQATSHMNKQTFYYSNATPQLARLNQQRWANLEEQVRNQVCADTLYVVTGAYYGDSHQTTADAVGCEVALPTAYFKVLLRSRSGDGGRSISEYGEHELQSIGFWVEHQYYSVLPAPVSVERVEELTGLTFFPTVPQSVKRQNEFEAWSLKESLFDL